MAQSTDPYSNLKDLIEEKMVMTQLANHPIKYLPQQAITLLSSRAYIENVIKNDKIYTHIMVAGSTNFINTLGAQGPRSFLVAVSKNCSMLFLKELADHYEPLDEALELGYNEEVPGFGDQWTKWCNEYTKEDLRDDLTKYTRHKFFVRAPILRIGGGWEQKLPDMSCLPIKPRSKWRNPEAKLGLPKHYNVVFHEKHLQDDSTDFREVRLDYEMTQYFTMKEAESDKRWADRAFCFACASPKYHFDTSVKLLDWLLEL